MQTIFHKNLVYLTILIGLILCMSLSTYSQPAHKAKERIEQLKKLKMLDMLDLDEESSEKFLIKYNALEKNIRQKKEQLDDAIEELKESIKDEEPAEELSKKSELVINSLNEMHKAHQQKLTEMRTVLDERTYAKYIVFESVFVEELRRNLFKMMQKKGEIKDYLTYTLMIVENISFDTLLLNRFFSIILPSIRRCFPISRESGKALFECYNLSHLIQHHLCVSF